MLCKTHNLSFNQLQQHRFHCTAARGLMDRDLPHAAVRLNDYWHTDKDTLDKLSPQSLEIAGRTILKAFPKIAQPPRRKQP